MKYICLAEEGGDTLLFSYPKEISTLMVLPVLNRALRTETHGRNWRRYQFKLVSAGGLIFKDGDVNQPVCILDREVGFLSSIQVTDERLALDLELLKKQLNEKTKYIATERDHEELHKVKELFTFPNVIHHDAFYEIVHQIDGDFNYRSALSAGFIASDFSCYGRSETLNEDSKPKEDTELLRKQMRV